MKYIKNIILVVLIGLVVYNLFTNNRIHTDVEAYNRKIDSLQTEIDSVEGVNKQLDNNIEKAYRIKFKKFTEKIFFQNLICYNYCLLLPFLS